MTRYQGEERRSATETNRTWLLILAAFLIPLLGAVAYGATLGQRVTAVEDWKKEVRDDLKEIRAGIEELRRRK